MTRREQIEKGADDNGYDLTLPAFVEGAEWADANPQDVALFAVDLIHQRSIAFDYGRDQAAMLKVAIEAMEESMKHFNSIQSGLTTNIHKVELLTKKLANEAYIEISIALKKIEQMKKEFDNGNRS